MSDIKLYVIYVDIGGNKSYYKGTTFFNKVEWCDNLNDAFFFNHEPRKHELLKVIENESYFNIGLSDVTIESLILTIENKTKISE